MLHRAKKRVGALLWGGGPARLLLSPLQPSATSARRAWTGKKYSGITRGHPANDMHYAGLTFSLRSMGTSLPGSEEEVKEFEVPVLIVGAGPVGTYLSLLLSRYGVPNMVIDRGERGGDHGLGGEGGAHPRAHVLNTRTMEVMRDIGIERELLDKMPPPEQWRYFRYGTSLLADDVAVIDHFDCGDGYYDNLTSNSPSHLAHLSQPLLEEVLHREARAAAQQRASAAAQAPSASSAQHHRDALPTTAGASFPLLLARTELASLRDEGDAVYACLVQTDAGGVKQHVRVKSRYLVACDGSRSTVRAACGISMSGGRGLEHFMSVHFRCKELWAAMRGRGAMLYFVLNEGVIACLVAHDLAKGEWVAQMPFFPEMHPTGLSASTIREQVDACIGNRSRGGPRLDFTVCSAKAWSMDGAVADTFQRGSVFLAGDAAHQFPPSGGFGLNTGLQDAHNLAWKLAGVLRGTAAASVLASYTTERRPVALANSDLSVNNHKRGLLVPSSTGLKREWLDQASEVLRSAYLPSWARAQMLETALEIGRAPLSLLQGGGSQGGLLGTLVGRPWARAMKEVVETGKALPMLFPKHDIGFVYAPSAAVWGEVAKNGNGAMGRAEDNEGGLYVPSGEPGARLPHAWLQSMTGDKISSHDLCCVGRAAGDAPMHVLVAFVASGADASTWTSLAGTKRCKVQLVDSWGRLEGQDWVTWKDEKGKFAQLCGVEKGGALLVRPDGHIAWRTAELPHEGDADMLTIKHWLSSGEF